MIDISPYQERLQLRKEWLHLMIDGALPLASSRGGEGVFIDIGVVPKLSWDEVIRMYDQTGVLYWNSNASLDLRPVSFDEYCKLKKYLC